MIQMTVEELKGLMAPLPLGELIDHQDSCGCSHSLCVGKKYLFRTVTMYYTGRVVEVTGFDVVLEDAAWIADTGRFSACLKTGQLNEVEPYPDKVALALGSIVDYTEWKHKLPREAK